MISEPTKPEFINANFCNVMLFILTLTRYHVIRTLSVVGLYTGPIRGSSGGQLKKIFVNRVS